MGGLDQRILYPLGPGLRERPGKGNRLLPVIKRPTGVSASIRLKKPVCGKCKQKCPRRREVI